MFLAEGGQVPGYDMGGVVSDGYPNGGQVPGYRFGGDMDRWDGQPGMSMYAKGGRVDDDALLYHAIDTQNFCKGGALRYCSGGYAR